MISVLWPLEYFKSDHYTYFKEVLDGKISLAETHEPANLSKISYQFFNNGHMKMSLKIMATDSKQNRLWLVNL